MDSKEQRPCSVWSRKPDLLAVEIQKPHQRSVVVDQVPVYEADYTGVNNPLKEITMAFKTMKPGALLAPVPAVLIGCGANKNDGIIQNVMTAAWTGTVCTHPLMVSVSIQPRRFSYELIEESGEFTVNLTTRELLRATDYCGVISGRDTDKWAKAGITPISADNLRLAPAVAESPLYL